MFVSNIIFISWVVCTLLDVAGNTGFLSVNIFVYNTNGYSLSKLITIFS
jgi:hypothetical protein